MSAQATLYRKDVLLNAGGLDEGLRCREDTYLFFLMGLNRPACAVAGIGAIVTADDEESRQTSIYHHDSRPYCDHTILLYKNVLRRCAPLPSRHRRALRRDLATMIFRRARLDLLDRDVLRCLALGNP